jgi:SAM-dependent methyltransferase
VAVAQGDVHALPFAAGSFDALFSLSVLQYGDAPTVLRECARVLKPGGKAVFIENLQGNPLAQSYRALHRRLRWQYAPDMTPRAHLQWEQRAQFGDFFGQVEFTVCHLTTPLAFVVPALKNRLWGAPMALHSLPLYRFLHGVDRRLLRRFPHLARYGWILVARVAKS